MDPTQTLLDLATVSKELNRMKSAFQATPAMPQPGMDPSMQGGPPPGMDPAMMQGGPPPPGMDPSMQGGPPPGMDPSQGGGAPGPDQIAQVLDMVVTKMEESDQRLGQLEQMFESMMGGLQQGNDPMPPGGGGMPPGGMPPQ